MDASVRASSNAGAGSADPKDGRNEHAFLKEHGVPTLIGLITVAVVTAVMMALSDYFVKDHFIFIYLLPITGIAMYFGSTPALVTSFTSVIGAAYFLIPPKFSLLIDERLQVAELFFFFMFAFVACKASNRLSR